MIGQHPVYRTLEIELLKTFLVVTELRGFTAASTVLHCTQSTVSGQIRRLEDAAGKTLIERSSKRFVLTDDGERLTRHAREIVRLHDEARTAMQRPVVSGKISLGVPEDFATRKLPFAIKHFRDAHPAVELHVRCGVAGELLAALESGELDLVIARRSPGRSGKVIRKEQLMWCADRSLAVGQHGILDLIMFPETCFYRSQVLRELERTKRKWRVVYTSPNLSGVLAAVSAGLGITVLPSGAVPSELRILGQREGLPVLGRTELVCIDRIPRRSRSATELVKLLVESLSSDTVGG